MKLSSILRRGLSALCIIVCTQSELFAEEQQELERPAQLPAITVTASPLNQSLLEYGKPVSVMDEDEIAGSLHSTLGETVGQEPGVRSSFFGQGASRPVIRGFELTLLESGFYSQRSPSDIDRGMGPDYQITSG